MKKLIVAALMMGAAISAGAQSGTNSPYSQYGLGVLADQASGFNRGMNGVGIGFHEHNQVNYLNPASYSSIDSLSFIFDMGATGQITNFTEGGVRKNAHNADLEYVVAGFRAAKNLGISFGILPFSTIGYNYTTSSTVFKGDDMNDPVSSVITHSGSGGLHQIYLGAGWSPIKGLSVGANLSYFWGTYERSTSVSFTETYAKTTSRVYSTNVHNYKLDLGVQYTLKALDKDWVTLGATFSPGHNLKADADLAQYSVNSSTNVTDTATSSIANAHKLPDMFGVGAMWNHNNQLKVGFDWTLQKWGSIGYPSFANEDNLKGSLIDGIYKDRKKYNLGIDFVPDERKRSYFKRVHYRMGFSYASPYLSVNGNDGPSEYSLTAGFGFPITNSYNNRSQLNISGQWVRTSAPGLIKENTFRINIGFTFNENWFAKWKVQ